MDFSLSEICSMLGDRLERYNSVAKKRRAERGSTAMKNKIAKLTSGTSALKIRKDDGKSEISTETPKLVTNPPTSASFSSATKMPAGETPKRRVMRVHKKIITNPKRLIFNEDDEFDD